MNNPSVSYADSSLYTREPLKWLHLNLMPRNMDMSNIVERSIANEENI